MEAWERELRQREREMDRRESEVERRERQVSEREAEVNRKERVLSMRELALIDKQQKEKGNCMHCMFLEPIPVWKCTCTSHIHVGLHHAKSKATTHLDNVTIEL